jgi:hypothetical protein
MIVSRKFISTAIAGLLMFTAMITVGCSDGATDNKQPKLTGTPDPKIKGPVTPSTGGLAVPQVPPHK